jgi:hypothetical protein
MMIMMVIVLFVIPMPIGKKRVIMMMKCKKGGRGGPATPEVATGLAATASVGGIDSGNDQCPGPTTDLLGPNEALTVVV